MSNREEAITTIPEMDTHSGDSSGIISQLKIAPETGIKNFQVLSSDTFTPGRCKSVNQMAKAAADKKLNQLKATKYVTGGFRSENPSVGIDIRINASPPKNKVEELNTIGDIP